MTDLPTLATRVELEPPSRELDAEIAALTRRFGGPVPGWFCNWGGEMRATSDGRVVAVQADGKDGPWVNAPHYTTSSDAAAGLMPAGWIVWEIGQDTDTQHWHAHLMDLRDSGIVRAVAPTEPQARTAAEVRAMEKERGNG